MRIKELLNNDSKSNLYKITKKIIQEQEARKDIDIEQCMKHDAYRRTNRRIKQIKWGR